MENLPILIIYEKIEACTSIVELMAAGRSFDPNFLSVNEILMINNLMRIKKIEIMIFNARLEKAKPNPPAKVQAVIPVVEDGSNILPFIIPSKDEPK